MNKKRIRKLNQKEILDGEIIYWMSRDQRVIDNWALIAAQKTAIEKGQKLTVIFNLIPDFPKSNIRHFDFLLKGLIEVEKQANEYGINFELLIGNPVDNIQKYTQKNNVGAVFVDFSPLRGGRKWRSEVAELIECAMYEVDTHNIVPVWITSPKQEFAARTIRPKVQKNLDEFLTDIPALEKNKDNFKKSQINWEDVYKKLNCDQSVAPVDWIKPGYEEGMKVFDEFVENKLVTYDELRNDPNEDNLSNLSVYYHYGQISPQRIAWELTQLKNKNSSDKELIQSIDAYLEEMIVRRELSDNYCFYNKNYDNFDGLADWAKKTLKEHWDDAREYIYEFEELENSKTHDDLWNAAQDQMVKTGKMHGYLRMYWAKKILEWTMDPKEAIEFGIKLNDKYSIDGRDPNGYVGVLWSVGGLHDRAWFERDVFGKIRYMNYNGAKRKFDVDSYIQNFL